MWFDVLAELTVFFDLVSAFFVLAVLGLVSPAAKADGDEIATSPMTRKENSAIFPRNLLFINEISYSNLPAPLQGQRQDIETKMNRRLTLEGDRKNIFAVV